MGGKSLASPRRNRRVVAAGASRGRGPLAGRRGSTCARVFGALHRAGPRRVGGRRRVPPVGPGSGCGRWRPAGARRRPRRWRPPFFHPLRPIPTGSGLRARIARRWSRARVAVARVASGGRCRRSRSRIARGGRGRGSRARVAVARVASGGASHCVALHGNGAWPPRTVPYIDKLLHLLYSIALPPFPPDLNIDCMANSPWAPQRLPTKCCTTELFRPAQTEPNIKIGGRGGANVGKKNDAQVGKSAGR